MSEVDIKRSEQSHIWKREINEHYVEPPWTSERLFQVETFNGVIWDPACGFGNIPESAKRYGLPAFGTDIANRGYACAGKQRDFLECTPDNISCIVSNPPFNIFRKFTEHALRLATDKVALLWLVRTLPAARWLQDTPLARIYLLTPRPSMPPGHVIASGEKPGGGKQDFCWLVFDAEQRGAPEMRWLHRDGA